MSNNIPFQFSAGGGQPPPALLPPQQQYSNRTPSNPQLPAQPTMAQQATSPQAGQFAGIDMSILNGVSPEQVAIIAHLLKTGAIPPPPPELFGPASVAAPSPSQLEAPELQMPHIEDALAHDEDVDMDKDEGEIEEVEVDTAKQPRGFLHPPPTGPRNPNANQRVPQLNLRKPSPRPPVPTQPVDRSRESWPQQSQQSQNSHVDLAKNVSTPGEKEIESKTLVLVMLKDGFSFEQILNEVGHPKALARLFTQMRLELPPQYSSTTETQTNGSTTPKPPTKRPAPVKPPPPAKPLDRSEYLARLQAAKNKKAEPTNATTATSKVTNKTDDAPKPEVEAAPTSFINNDTNKAKPKPEDKTALARQRLEALKALQAARSQAALQSTAATSKSSPVLKPVLPNISNRQAASSPTQPGLGAGLETIATRASQVSSYEPSQLTSNTAREVQGTNYPQPLISPPPPTPTQSIGGLPGLFMFGQPTQVRPPTSSEYTALPAPVQQQTAPPSSFPASIAQPSPQTLGATPTASPAALHLPRKRPVASDFDYPAPKPKRPFGLSRGNSADESLIITISDDEDDDADDEMDTDYAEPPKNRLPTASFRDAAPLYDFPPRPNFQVQPSGQSTPGGSTPGGVTYEQRMKEIEEMKRKIAEREARKNANGKASMVPKAEPSVSTVRSDAPSPAPRGSSGSTPKVVDAPLAVGTAPDGMMHNGPPSNVAVSAVQTLSERPNSATTLARYQEKERLRQRLLELQRDEFKDVTEAVEAAADLTGPIEETSQSLSRTVVEVESTPVVAETQMPQTAPEGPNEMGSEEGEISDDSLSNFYGPADAQDVRADPPAAAQEQEVESQTSTASDTSADEELANHSQPQSVDDAQPASHLPESLAETQLPDSAQQDFEMVETVPDSIAPSEPALEAEDAGDQEDSESMSEDSEFDEDSDDDSEDLDESLPNRQLDATTTDTNGDGGSDSIEAHADTDDYDPVPSERMETTSEPDDQVGKSATAAAISGASSTEPAMKDVALDDDRAPELQPPTQDQSQVLNQIPDKPHFKPYVSALRGFKDFKWHPDFLSTASQGFKSPTFSHKIDADKPLCPFEGSGGQCNDPTCGFQHFKDMGLTDNELLKLLGTHNAPAHSQEEQKRWNEGLGTVIRQLRLANVNRDVNAIATAISEFRKEFVGDKTKVLNLG